MIPFALIGAAILSGLVAFIRRACREQREFDARLDEQRAASYGQPQLVERDGGYVPIHELNL